MRVKDIPVEHLEVGAMVENRIPIIGYGSVIERGYITSVSNPNLPEVAMVNFVWPGKITGTRHEWCDYEYLGKVFIATLKSDDCA